MENCKYKLIFKDGGEGITFPSISLNNTENYSFEDFVNSFKNLKDEQKQEILDKLTISKNKRYITDLNINNVIGTTSLNTLIENSNTDRHPIAKNIGIVLEQLKEILLNEDPSFNPNLNSIIYTSVNSLEDPELFSGQYNKELKKLIVNSQRVGNYANVNLAKIMIDYILDVKNVSEDVRNSIENLSNLFKTDPKTAKKIITELSKLLNISTDSLELIYSIHLGSDNLDALEKYSGKSKEDGIEFKNKVFYKFKDLVSLKDVYYSDSKLISETDNFKLNDLLDPGSIVTIPARNKYEFDTDLIYVRSFFDKDKNNQIYMFIDLDNKSKFFTVDQLKNKDGNIKFKANIIDKKIDFKKYNYDEEIEKDPNTVILYGDDITTDIIKTLDKGDYIQVTYIKDSKSFNAIYKIFERNGDKLIYGNRKQVYSRNAKSIKPSKIIKFTTNEATEYYNDAVTFKQTLYPININDLSINDIVKVDHTFEDGNIRTLYNQVVAISKDQITILSKDTETKRGKPIKIKKESIKEAFKNYSKFKTELDELNKLNTNDSKSSNKIIEIVTSLDSENKMNSDIDIHFIDTSIKTPKIKSELNKLKQSDIIIYNNEVWIISNVIYSNSAENKLELIKSEFIPIATNTGAFLKHQIIREIIDLSDVQKIVKETHPVYLNNIKNINSPLILDNNIELQSDVPYTYKDMYLISTNEKAGINDAVWKDIDYFRDEEIVENGKKIKVPFDKELLKLPKFSYKGQIIYNLTKNYLNTRNMSAAKGVFVKTESNNVVGLKNIIGYISKRIDNIPIKKFMDNVVEGTYISILGDYNIYRVEEVDKEKGILVSYSNNNKNGTLSSYTKFITTEELSNTKGIKGEVKNRIWRFYIPTSSTNTVNNFKNLGESIYSETNNIVIEDTDSTNILNLITKKLKNDYNIEIVSYDNIDEIKDKYKIPKNLAKNAKAFVYNGRIFISGKININDVAHEFMHLLLGTLKIKDFNLYKQIVSIKVNKKFEEEFEKELGSEEYSGLTGLERKEEIFVRAFGSQVMKISNQEVFYNNDVDLLLNSLIYTFLGIKTIDPSLAIDVYNKSLKDLLNKYESDLLKPESFYDRKTSIQSMKLSNLKNKLNVKCD